ncbi:hypothetical protein [Chamaesiphon sp. VAR_48_metabat_135_sub]|uniref:hypothetical protein n=1 Tax=Chamaesiphon sp. VAR_48_metabat_135_sub TaxID=2964699 RepID=UPI00286A4D65|nr:hypothetical protein [Chamaesiphon sp. VAR_48_metabat_135_sub]
MFNRQFGLLVMATFLLSPTLVNASAFDEGTHLSVGNVQIHTTENGTTLRTPKIQIDTPNAAQNRVLISGRRRLRTPAIKRPRVLPAAAMRRKIESNVQTTINKTSPTNNSTIRSTTIQNTTIRGRRVIPAPSTQVESNVQTIINKTLPANNSTIQNSTVRSSTIRNSSNGSHSVNENRQSVHCSGGGSSVSQSISTVNGRTVRSEVRGNCGNNSNDSSNDD